MSDVEIEHIKVALAKCASEIERLEKQGLAWIDLFKKMNSDRMLEILALRGAIGNLEKHLVEPVAQSLVDQVGSSYKPMSYNCPHCQRPMK